jgi:hypothetical protein
MQLHDGIAVVKVDTPQAGLPANAEIQLFDDQGPYADGPVTVL